MEKLRAFLFQKDTHNDSPRYTVRTIRHRYLTWKRERVLHHLGPREMSALIILFGTLSTSTPGQPSNNIFARRHRIDMPESDFAPHWDLVLGICQDKRRLQYPLLISDTYWLMRARLAGFLQRVDSGNTQAELWLSSAKQCYSAIRDRSPHHDLHLPYFQVLLASPSVASPSEDHFHDFAVHVQDVLSRFGRLHPRIRNLFYQSILSQPHVAPRSKAELLAAVSERFIGQSNLSQSQSPPASLTSATGLTFALERAVFEKRSALGSSSTPDGISQWAGAVVRRLFQVSKHADATIDLRWNCLVLLALVRTSSSAWNGESADASSDPEQRAAVMEWQTVCVLAALENILGPIYSSTGETLSVEVIQGFSGVLRKLWHDWTTIPLSSRPLCVARVICASFLNLSGRLKDKVLVEAVREHCISIQIWSNQERDSRSVTGLQALATEQLFAALACDTFFERALVDLVVCTTDMNILRGAVNAAVSRYSLTDPEHAQELLAWASNRGIAPSAKVTARVGVALARSGISGYLDRYIAHPLLSAELRARVLVAYLKMFASHGRQFMEPRTVANLSADTTLLLTQVENPKPMLRSLQPALLVLIREGFAAGAVAFAEAIAVKLPTAIPATFYTQFLGALLRHRQFRLARRVLAHCLTAYPDMASRWAARVFFLFARGGASRLASGLPRSRSMYGSLRPAMIALSRHGRACKRASVTTLGLHSAYGRKASPAAALHTIRLLVLSGRVHAAKKLYERIYQQESTKVCTASGNMILYGAVYGGSRSRGQRARALAYTFRTLTKQFAFIPDRVTVNIMVKTLLFGQDIDMQRARALFDAMVQMGYPTGAVAQVADQGDDRATPTIFNTELLDELSIGGVKIPRLASPIMYVLHVRPLYKTFVKAFYGLGDVDAARSVIGILKVLEAQNMRRLAEGRDWAVGGTR
ncbi:hypothetical protein C8Q79DRAFT_904457 [Trametes meyenii]|nr:hypothetical protein C8Q79DRAFT_904457 [Trametes meyenii]